MEKEVIRGFVRELDKIYDELVELLDMEDSSSDKVLNRLYGVIEGFLTLLREG